MHTVFNEPQAVSERLLPVDGNITLLNICGGALPRVVVSHPCRCNATHQTP